MAIEIFGFGIPVWIPLILILALLIYKYSTHNFGFWENLGVKGPPPAPFAGNSYRAFVSQGMMEFDKEVIQKYGKVAGIFQSNKPVLLVADVDMLKEIQVKEFGSFQNRQNILAIDDTLSKMVSLARGEEWHRIRNTITPAFSSGKLRRMKMPMNRCAKLLVDNLQKKAKSGEAFDVKACMGAYTMDVIASTAFGLDIDSQKDPNNPFLSHADTFNFNAKSPLLILLIIFPKLAIALRKYFGLSTFPKESIKFFTDIVDRAMAARTETDKATRIDFLQLMVNAHKDEDKDEDDNEDKAADKKEPSEDAKSQPKKGLTHEEILAQGFVFFLAGYSTVSHALTFTLYLLATNPDAQETLYQDIMSVLGDGKDPDYDSLNKIHYLEMVINESLRVYPTAVRVDRQCSKDTVINGVHIPKDTIIAIPIQYLHMDPDVWSDPEKFDPERFSPEKKATINPFSWQPFGMGPRNCIGMRLALMDLKMALVYMVKNFHIQTCDKTNIPLQRNSVGQPKDVFLKLTERE